MEAITKKDVLTMTAAIVAGILANPINGNIGTDQWQQREIITMTFQNVMSTFTSLGIPMEQE